MLLAGAAWQAGAQTTVDLTRQGKLGTGTVLPVQCAAGQVFFKTDAPAGANVYACTSLNVWTAMGVSSAGDGIVVSGNTVAVEDAVVPMYYTGAGAPAITCVKGRDFYIDTTAGNLYFCKAAGQWQAASSVGHTHAAADIVSGTFSNNLLPAGVVINSQANTYTAGQRQSVTHDATNAGLRLVPAAGDPANAQDGDVWYNLATNTFRRRQAGAVADWGTGSGGGGSSFDPNDTTTFWMVEEFPPSGVSNTYIGTYGWAVANFYGGCSSVFEHSFTNRPGVLDLQANGSNGGCSATLDGLFPSLAALAWKAKWSWSADSSYTTSNFTIRIGIGNAANTNTIPTDGVWARLQAGSDTTWKYELYSGGALVGTVDSGVSYTAANLYTAQFRGDGAKWYVSLSTNGAAFSTEKSICPSGCDLSGTLPAVAVGPFASVLHSATLDGAAKRLYLDRFSMQITGVSR